MALLRTISPLSTVRLSNLVQNLPDSDVEIGWLLEAESPADDAQRVVAQLRDLVRDLRLMGLQPTLLEPAGSMARPRSTRPQLAAVNGGHRTGDAA
jgi:hypothetical protein